MFSALIWAQTDDKVSATVRRLAAGKDTVSVFVLGSYQPQEEIAGQWKAVLGNNVEAEERTFDRLAGQLFVVEAALERARKGRDAAIVGLRREVSRQVRREIQPQQDRLTSLLTRAGAGNLRPFHAVNMIAADVPVSALDTLAADAEVGRIVSLQKRRFHLDISTQAIHATDVWLQGVTGKGEAVGILDSGIRADHDLFKGKEVIHRPFVDSALALLRDYEAEFCLAENPASGEDKVGHGTHVAGIVASGGSRRYPTVRGVGSGVGQVYNLKIGIKLDESRCEPDVIILDPDWIAALQWAVTESPVRVFNMSFGGEAGDDQDDDLVVDQIADAYGAILVISAGNSGPGPKSVATPGNAYNVISVASRDDHRTADPSDDTIAQYSSRGPTRTGRFKPDVAAPGSNISSADARSTGDLADLSGTSMAAPHVAGAVALMFQAGIKDNIAIKSLLINSADQSGWKDDRGWGYVNLQRAHELKDRLMSVEVQPGLQSQAARYWRGRLDGRFQATMVWNRHVSLDDAGKRFGVLSELDMFLYDRAGGALLAKSDLWGQNVEQITAEHHGEAILKIAPASSGFAGAKKAEKVALSLTQSGFEPMAGPALTSACALATAASAGGPFEIGCTVRNPGDLPVDDVQGTLAVPVGFRSSGAAAFGTLRPGEQATRRFTITAGPRASTFTGFQARISGTSYGETLRSASEPLTVVVGAAVLPRLAAPASIEFDYRLGSEVPAPKRVTFTSTGEPLQTRFQLTGGSWLGTVSELSGITPSEFVITVNPAGLAVGEYRGAVVASAVAAGSTTEVAVILRVTAPSATVVDSRITRSYGASCQAPAPATHFSHLDERAVYWYSISAAQLGDRIAVEWIAPGGFVHSVSPAQTAGSAGDLCGEASLEVAGKAVSLLSGEWTARLVIDGRPAASVPFFLTRVEVESFTLNASPAGQACPTESGQSNFTFAGGRVTAWLKVNGAPGGDRYSVTWFDPARNAHHTQFFNNISSGSSCLAASLALPPDAAVTLPAGKWTVTGYWNGAVIANSSFTLR
jgi:serine protease AprX